MFTSCYFGAQIFVDEENTLHAQLPFGAQILRTSRENELNDLIASSDRVHKTRTISRKTKENELGTAEHLANWVDHMMCSAAQRPQNGMHPMLGQAPEYGEFLRVQTTYVEQILCRSGKSQLDGHRICENKTSEQMRIERGGASLIR